MASSRSRFSSTEQGRGPSLEARPPDTSSWGGVAELAIPDTGGASPP